MLVFPTDSSWASSVQATSAQKPGSHPAAEKKTEAEKQSLNLGSLHSDTKPVNHRRQDETDRQGTFQRGEELPLQWVDLFLPREPDGLHVLRKDSRNYSTFHGISFSWQ